MKKPKQAGRGRPKADPGERFTRRHVVNVTPAMDEALKRYATDNGIARATDAIRQLLTIVMREKELL